MADLNKAVASKIPSFSGAFGNASQAVFTYTAAAADIADVIYLGKLPKYAIVTGVVLYTANLGANVNLDVGYITAELDGTLTADDDYWLVAADAHEIARTQSAAAAIPKQFNEEIYVTATVDTAAATGTFTVVVDFLHVND